MSQTMIPGLKAPEQYVMRAVGGYLELHPRVATYWRANSGAVRMGAGAGTGGRFMRINFPGCPDYCGHMDDGRALYVECKSTDGRVRENQREFLNAAKAAGCVAVIARSVDDVVDALTEAGY